MGRVDDKEVRARGAKGFHSFVDVVGDADGGSGEEAAACISGGIRVLNGFFDILNGDQTHEMVAVVDKRQFFDLVLLHHLQGVVHGNALFARDQIITGHDAGDFFV